MSTKLEQQLQELKKQNSQLEASFTKKKEQYEHIIAQLQE